MNILIPGNVPQLSPDRVRLLLNEAISRDSGLISAETLRSVCPVMVLAIRGYYENTMGAAGKNDVGMFDDAAFLVSGDRVVAYNWNTDPSRVGWNPAIGKPFAMLAPGLWPFIAGQHKGNGPAWRQPDDDQAKRIGLSKFFSDSRLDGSFRVFRDRDGVIDSASPSETGYFAINIHWGGEVGTSSWGCQTAPPAQWVAFQKLSYKLAKGQPFLPYVLIDKPTGI